MLYRQPVVVFPEAARLLKTFMRISSRVLAIAAIVVLVLEIALCVLGVGRLYDFFSACLLVSCMTINAACQEWASTSTESLGAWVERKRELMPKEFADKLLEEIEDTEIACRKAVRNGKPALVPVIRLVRTAWIVLPLGLALASMIQLLK
jgi:hypothetical protein